MDLPLDPVGNLKTLFLGLPPQGGYNFGKTKKIQTFPMWHLLQYLVRIFSILGGGIFVPFNGPSGARPANGLASQRVRSSPQPASFLYLKRQENSTNPKRRFRISINFFVSFHLQQLCQKREFLNEGKAMKTTSKIPEQNKREEKLVGLSFLHLDSSSLPFCEGALESKKEKLEGEKGNKNKKISN